MTDKLIHDLENADAETCYEAVLDFVDAVLPEDDSRRRAVLMAWSVAMNFKQPALLLGVVAALVPEGWRRMVESYPISERPRWARALITIGTNRHTQGNNFVGIEACALAAAILKAMEANDEA